MKPPLRQGSPDDFQTPPFALTPLFPYIKKDWIVWEPAQGKANLVKGFKDKGYDVFGTDIITGEDFLIYEPERRYDCIITNPPFKLKQEFLARCYSLGKPFALLLPLTAFETEKRQNLFNQYGVDVILFNKRINFETPNQIENSSSWFATAWFTCGLKMPKQLTFEKLLTK